MNSEAERAGWAPGWYEDPRTRAKRYWDGQKWALEEQGPEKPPGVFMPQPGQVVFAAAPPTNGLAVAGFVLSLVGIVLCGVGSVIGFILSWIAFDQIKRSGGTQGGKGLAVAGLVIGGIVTGIMVLWMGFFVLALGSGST